MKPPKALFHLTALLGMMALNTAIDSVNPRLTTASVEHLPDLLFSHSTTISLQTSPGNRINQPVRTAEISLGLYVAIFLVFGVVVFAVITPRGVVVIGKDEVGIVIKKFNLNPFFPKLSAGQLIALKGEAGSQAKILTPGMHWGYFPWMYIIRKESVINISPGEIGLVVANDGAPMPPEQLLGKVVECSNFQDAGAFIKNGGQKGRQLAIFTAGTYQINTDLFTVITAANATQYGMNPQDLQVYTVDAGKIGIVTTYEGKSIEPGEIAGSPVTDHGNFQNGQKFIDCGGCKGLQQEILSPGSWNLNPWFVKVEQIELTDVPVGTVGVIISHVGKPSENQAGVVEPGYKGVWNTPLPPGKHVINTKVMNVEIVPTQPIALDWSNRTKPSLNYDANLRAIQLLSKDGFCFDIEVTQVIRVAEENASTMIYRVGNTVSGSASDSIKALIVKILKPAVSNYFCNSAQNSEALDFLDKRSDQQRQAKDYIKSALSDFAVEAVETLIGEIDLPGELQKILTDRKIAEEQRKTIEVQQRTEEQRQQLAYAEALRKIQPDVVAAEQGVKIAELKAIAERYAIEIEIERVRQLREIEVEILRITIDIIGHEGWLDVEKLKELVKLKLPEVWVSNSHDGGSGLIDAVMPQVLRTLKTTTIGSSNSLSIAHQANQTLETSSPSTALPQG